MPSSRVKSLLIDTPKERHDHAILKFPAGFLWGGATSAHQVEGNNLNSDWWEWEQTHQPPEKRSGKAADQYHLFEQDLLFFCGGHIPVKYPM